MLELRVYMQISKNDIVIIISVLTGAFLIVGLFVLAYITLYNQRKKKHSLQTIAMQKEFEQELVKTQMEVQEHTLQTIASDIHDNIGQLLSITKLTLTSITPDGDIEKNSVKLNNAKELLNNATTELRQLASLLHAENLLANGLQTAIGTELNWLSKSERLRVNYSTKGETEAALSHQTELIAYRITQELLNNVVKHAEASEVNVTVFNNEDGIEISIEDNGKGFRPEETRQNSNGLGMRTLFNRAKLIRAKLHLQSEEGKGTRAILFIPYTKTSAHDRPTY